MLCSSYSVIVQVMVDLRRTFNVGHQQQFFSELPSPGRSHYTYYWYSWVQTIDYDIMILWSNLGTVNTKPIRTFLVRFGIISDSFVLAMPISARLLLAKIRTMAGPNSPGMAPKCAKKVLLGIKTTFQISASPPNTSKFIKAHLKMNCDHCSNEANRFSCTKRISFLPKVLKWYWETSELTLWLAVDLWQQYPLKKSLFHAGGLRRIVRLDRSLEDW